MNNHYKGLKTSKKDDDLRVKVGIEKNQVHSCTLRKTQSRALSQSIHRIQNVLSAFQQARLIMIHPSHSLEPASTIDYRDWHRKRRKVDMEVKKNILIGGETPRVQLKMEKQGERGSFIFAS